MKGVTRVFLVALGLGSTAAGLARAQVTDNVTATKHNLSVTPITGVKNYGEVCVYCHTPHGGSTQAPLWNRSLPSAASFTMYTSPTIDMIIGSGPGPVSLACLSCHDGSIGLDAITNFPNTATDTIPSGVKIDGPGRTNGWAKLGTDLRDDHPVGVTYDITADPAFNSLASAKTAEARFAGTLSVLASSRSWQTRAAAARALGGMSGQEPAIVRLSFLQDVHPAVRVAAAMAADCGQSLVAQRLMWTAVNDASDAVRLAAYESLAKAADPNVRREGFKGVRDDSVWVRGRFVWNLQLVETPLPESVPALLAATADVDPKVVKNALVVARVLGEKLAVKAEDFAHVAKSSDPRVQRAYLELVLDRGWPLDAADRQQLQKSMDPVVVAMAGL